MNNTASTSAWLHINSTWPTSLVLSLLLLGGYRVLERPGFLLLITAVGLWHLLACIRFAPRPSSELVLSQSLVAVATVAAVALHVYHVVGGPGAGLWQTVGSFALAELSQISTYLFFGLYLLVFALVTGVLLFLARMLKLRTEMTPGLALSTAFAASAVNLGFDYSLSRPLYHVSGEPNEAFFFAAGLFGLEFSLPLHLILLLTYCAVLVLAAPSRDVPGTEHR